MILQTLSKDLLLEKMIDLCDYGRKLIEKELIFKLKAIWTLQSLTVNGHLIIKVVNLGNGMVITPISLIGKMMVKR